MNQMRRAAIVCGALALALLVHVLAWFWPMGFRWKPFPEPIPDPIGGGIAVVDSNPNDEQKDAEKHQAAEVAEPPAEEPQGQESPKSETALSPAEKPESKNGDVQVDTDAPTGVLLTIDWPDRETVERACAQLRLCVVGFKKVDGELSYAGEIRFDGGLHLAKLDSNLDGFSNRVRRLPRGLFEPLLSNERLDGAVLLLPTTVESDFRAVVDLALADAGLSKAGPACAYGRMLFKPGFEPRLVVQRVEATVTAKGG